MKTLPKEKNSRTSNNATVPKTEKIHLFLREIKNKINNDKLCKYKLLYTKFSTIQNLQRINA